LSDDLTDAAARRRFQREAQMTSSLNHPDIVSVYDAGEIEGWQYLVTEFVDGGTLSDRAKQEERGWRQAVELLTGVADGLATAHAANMLHRDIKPAKILVTKSGHAKLEEDQEADPSRTLAESGTRPGAVIGTISYMLPEQASGQQIDARAIASYPGTKSWSTYLDRCFLRRTSGCSTSPPRRPAGCAILSRTTQPGRSTLRLTASRSCSIA
jgi:serine/threonine protein kinase